MKKEKTNAGSTFDKGPVRVWAVVDIVVTAPLLLPTTALWLIDVLYRLNSLWEASVVMPQFMELHLLFICLTGALGVLWALVRLLWPLARLSLADTLGRLWVAGLITLFITTQALPSVLWIFVLTEMSGALHQGLSLIRYGSVRNARNSSSPSR